MVAAVRENVPALHVDWTLAALRPILDRLLAAAVELAALKEAIRSGAARERERLVMDFGDCCMGADPACSGPRGCLLIYAMNRPEVRAAIGLPAAEGSR